MRLSFYCLSLLFFFLGVTHFWSEDVLFLKNGSQQKGEIVGATPDAISIVVKVGTSEARLSQPVTQVERVEMDPPEELKAVKKENPEATVAVIKPLLEKFRGLPSPWLVDAMGILGDAYLNQGKMEEAKGIYGEIEKLFPNSKFVIKATVGRVKVALKSNAMDEALALLAPLIQEANKTVAPTTADGQVYGEAFLTHGKIMEARGKLPEALESFLTVTTCFYQHEATLKEAESAARALLEKNPNLNVN